ncbi:MAG: hypothetical protein ACI8PZ_003056 [Myxococcota bacterium]|jgi:hypothetical protein
MNSVFLASDHPLLPSPALDAVLGQLGAAKHEANLVVLESAGSRLYFRRFFDVSDFGDDELAAIHAVVGSSPHIVEVEYSDLELLKRVLRALVDAVLPLAFDNDHGSIMDADSLREKLVNDQPWDWRISP